jgi:hypothetical protein
MFPWYFKYKPNKPSAVQAETQKPVYMTLLLVPAGDAHNQGRSLEHQFESGSTMALVYELKTTIEKKYPEVRVVLSHKAGEVARQFQVPTMANTLGIDLVLTINCYHEQGPRPELYVYQFSYGTDFVTKLPELSWYTLDSAYLFSFHTTQAWATTLAQGLNADEYKTLFFLRGPYKLPFKPLLGIKVPAIGLEMSLKQDDDWTVYVDPLVNSLAPIVMPMLKQRASSEVV